MIESWTIPGARNQPILGDTHSREGDAPPAAHLVICHGFKGYKDYGFLPVLAHHAATRGYVVHRFNFSHSGMTKNVETFERPELFEQDTWSKQIHDLSTVSRAIRDGALPGCDGERSALPQIWFGHSRGGVTVLLTAARASSPGDDQLNDDDAPPAPAGVIAAAAPHQGHRLGEDERRIMRKQGYLSSPSSRTQQELRIGKAWLDEIDADPDAFDPLLAAKRIACPALIVHGDEDATVAVDAAHHLAAAAPHAELRVIKGATHVFNTKNPASVNDEPSPQLQELIDAVCEFGAKLS